MPGGGITERVRSYTEAEGREGYLARSYMQSGAGVSEAFQRTNVSGGGSLWPEHARFVPRLKDRFIYSSGMRGLAAAGYISPATAVSAGEGAQGYPE
jgi:hypothetical protein